jgi:conjugal transfer pilus assembly protein TrbC
MAHVAEKKLLRSLILSGMVAGVLGMGTALSHAEDQPPVQFAPGATGKITAPLVDIVREAERRGEALADSLTIQSARDGVEIEDLEGIRTRALNDPRVRNLLGVEEADETDGQGEKYADTRAILFASFSMPPESLLQMMREANAYGLNVVFRGFVNNSVYDTRIALEEVFADDEEGEGFAIDPTLFRRFDIQAVPALVVLGEELDVCNTPACEDDVSPIHDRLSGNIPLETALKLIAAGNGDAWEAARAILDAKP